MQSKYSFLSLFLLFFTASYVSAQAVASFDSEKLTPLKPSEFAIHPDEWTFYLDKENKVYYIDFESINVNLSDIRVLDKDGDIVKSDKLWDLPVNTIYELNISDLKPGNYKVELRSYTGMIENEIILSE
ncbi:MAG: hypothetical protein K9J37_05505 [Saprospiraceae bacterium]|nr:hypothetical protein [Saprospiraceae bacterium]MCF8249346.1 hypothetical protein [Saprospiraceae bacterium]MCF8311377.1 hypothetical protein [Saprospiraceae bacterium]MCF8439965.1 hypothetical protein [Saprospiraceae bacterium]